MKHELTIRGGQPDDARALAKFARRMFDQAFGEMNDPVELESYLAHTFGLEQQTRELGDPAWSTRVVECGGHLVAYAQLRAGDAPATVTGVAPLELARFYIDRPWHGHGLADELIEDVTDVARGRGAGTIWLSVWQVNARAISFYNRRGFHIVGEQTFHIGTDAQTDWLMALSLDPGGATD